MANENQEVANAANEQAPFEVKVDDVLLLMKQGKTRKQISDKYGLSAAEAKMLWSHPELKNKKVYKTQVVRPGFAIVGTTPANTVTTSTPTPGVTSNEAPQESIENRVVGAPTVQERTGAFSARQEG